MTEVTPTMLCVSEMAVLRVLERAGGRLLRRQDRAGLNGVRPWELHAHLQTAPDRMDRLMASAWDLPSAAGLPDELIATLDSYVRALLLTGRLFDRDDLYRCLARMPEQELPWEARIT
ncbi:hypothetical protein AB0D30_00945 [Streptomyces sp. NPDC048409]|uniref:hypothetical protein n=1 Tax=Streptomyces sp. NPDC048409 TaxID=3154723 RepID=UPI0034422753